MKLLAATLKNYRIHHEVTIEFDGSRTLIGGPNEVGKSTLIEGIHRGLFLKAKGTGALHKSMVSNLHGSHPEVEVRFEAGGREYTIRKRFSGQTGSSQLIESGGQTWQGDDAEEKLAAVLGSEEASGRATASKIKDQWAHLWVWQGMAGEDPIHHLTSRQDDLLQQLHDVGGSVAMQSALDGRVAARFKGAREQIFVKAGNARAGSDLEKAQAELRDAQSSRESAANRLAQLEDAIAGFENAEATLQRTQMELQDLAAQREELNKREAQVAKLQQLEGDQKRIRETTSEKLATLESAEKSITDLRTQLDELARSLSPKQETLKRGEAEVTGLRDQTEKAEQDLDAAQARVREARLRADLAAAHVRVLEVRSRQQEINKRLQRVRTLQEEIANRLRQLHALPVIDRKGLGKLQKLEGKLAQAIAALNAMAAGIEVLSADAPIRVGEETLDPGASCTLTESTLIAVGDTVEIRIHPGGGDRLEAAREQVRSLREQFQTALDSAGLESLEQAATIVVSREHLEAQIEKANASLEELDPEEAERSAKEIENELTAAEAEVARGREKVDSFDAPETLDDAKASREAQSAAVQQAEEGERVARASHEGTRRDLAKLDKQLTSIRSAIDKDQQQQTDFKARLNLLLENHGADATRAQALEEIRQAVASALSELTTTQQDLKKLQPELLPADKTRLERSLAETNRQREAAQTDRAVCQSALRSDGSEDPKAALAQAEARLQASREHHDAVSRKAGAIALVDDLFQQEQRALADRFSQPLADKISGYLQCLFGPAAKAVVTFEDNAFTAINIVRSASGGALTFDVLSGGAREQVAAAVRLAMAELLAAEFGGTLPIVFDDAFAYSDPERVQILQRMLDLGASRGLQIIVLSCNPSDYAGLGARQVSLTLGVSSPSPATATKSAATSDQATTANVSNDGSEAFLAALQELGGKAGNQALREHLGWDEDRYSAVKESLVTAGQIVPGRGRGGSVTSP